MGATGWSRPRLHLPDHRLSYHGAMSGDVGTSPDDGAPLTNGELARIFHEIGDILEVKGELVFKTVAYHRAADAIARAPFDVATALASPALM